MIDTHPPMHQPLSLSESAAADGMQSPHRTFPEIQYLILSERIDKTRPRYGGRPGVDMHAWQHLNARVCV